MKQIHRCQANARWFYSELVPNTSQYLTKIRISEEFEDVCHTGLLMRLLFVSRTRGIHGNTDAQTPLINKFYSFSKV